MAGSTSPIEIGTQGTIGSLLSQEIEYFKRIDTDHHHHRSSQKSKKVSIQDMTSRSTSSINKKKKQSVASSSGGFLPCICSVVEISNAGGTGYINLRTDCNKFMQD